MAQSDVAGALVSKQFPYHGYSNLMIGELELIRKVIRGSLSYHSQSCQTTSEDGKTTTSF